MKRLISITIIAIAMISTFAYHLYAGEMVPAFIWFVLIALMSLSIVYKNQTIIHLILAAGLSVLATLVFLGTFALGYPRKLEMDMLGIGFICSWMPTAFGIAFIVWAARIEWIKRKAIP